MLKLRKLRNVLRTTHPPIHHMYNIYILEYIQVTYILNAGYHEVFCTRCILIVLCHMLSIDLSLYESTRHVRDNECCTAHDTHAALVF